MIKIYSNNRIFSLQIAIASLLAIAILSCNISNKSSKCGVVTFNPLFYYPDKKKYLYNENIQPNYTVWYKDNSVIVQVKGISTESENGVTVKKKILVLYYTFIDLRKMLFYQYRNFSDTAVILRSYSLAQADSLFWGPRFYKKNDISNIQSFIKLADTIIDDKVFKRQKMVERITGDNDSFQTSIGYFDCTRQGTLFQINKSISEYVGCPMVGYYLLPTQKYPTPPATEIKFISEELKINEIRVFDAWEKNEKKYPVKQ